MTNPGENVVVDADRIDEGRRSWPTVLSLMIIGAILGLLVGGAFGATRPASYEADTALSVLPDPTLGITANDNSNNSGVASLDATAYIQSQLVIINGRQLADRVQSDVGLANRPDVVATQVGETYVVQIQATSTSRSGSLATAKAIGAAYDTVRSRQLTVEINGLLASVRQQLASVQSSLTAQLRGARADAPLSPSETALQTQYEQLLSERSSLKANLAQVGSVVTVVTPAAIATAGLSTAKRDALGGFVLGAILGLVALFVFRRAVQRVRSVSDLAALGVPVLLPVQPRRSRRSLSSSHYWQSPPARLLAARLYADALRVGKPLVIVGATPKAGTTQVAATVSAALAGRGPVLLVTDAATSDVAAPDLSAPVIPAPVIPAPEIPAFDDTTASPTDWHPETADGTSAPESSIDREPVVASSVPGVWLLDATPIEPGLPAAWRLMDLVQRASHVGWLVVVDAGAVSTSDLAVQLARIDAAVTLVIGRGTSSPAQVLAATELFEAEDMTSTGAVLNDVPGRLWQRVVGRAGRAPTVVAADRGSDHQIPSDSPLWESLLDDFDTNDQVVPGHRAPQDVTTAPRHGSASS